MNIIKIGLVLLAGVGFGFGVDKLANNEVNVNQRVGYYGHMDEGYCHGDENFIEHMLDELTDEEVLLVQVKIDELLVEYDITLEELKDDYEVRYDFMDDLMEFLDENDIDFHNYGSYHNHNRGYGRHGGMGMH